MEKEPYCSSDYRSPGCQGKTEAQPTVTADVSTSLKLLLSCSAIDEKYGNG